MFRCFYNGSFFHFQDRHNEIRSENVIDRSDVDDDDDESDECRSDGSRKRKSIKEEDVSEEMEHRMSTLQQQQQQQQQQHQVKCDQSQFSVPGNQIILTRKEKEKKFCVIFNVVKTE